MTGNKTSGSPVSSDQKGSGISAAITGSGNVINHQVNDRPGKVATIVVPILAAIISGVGGAYTAHSLTVSSASAAAEKQTEGLVVAAGEVVNFAKSSGSSLQLISKVEELAAQAKAAQASMNLAKANNSAISSQADFWLPEGRAVILGGKTAYSVIERYNSGRLKVKIDNRNTTIEAGSQLEYETVSGDSCKLVYLLESPDQKLFGFRNVCD